MKKIKIKIIETPKFEDGILIARQLPNCEDMLNLVEDMEPNLERDFLESECEDESNSGWTKREMFDWIYRHIRHTSNQWFVDYPVWEALVKEFGMFIEPIVEFRD